MITFSMTLSADGYVAGPEGSFDWAVPSEELHRFHNERVGAVDAQLLGRRGAEDRGRRRRPGGGMHSTTAGAAR